MRQFPRFLAAAILLIAILAGCSMNYPAPRKFAVIYGIEDYPAPNRLYFTVDDAVAMESMFLANGFASGDVILRIDLAATKVQLQADLATLAGSMAPNDVFVFYYSGHGTNLYTINGAPTEWILPSGSINGSGTFVPANAIYDAELGTMLDVLPTTRRVVILDSCNSGGLIGQGLEADTVPPLLSGHTTWAGIVTPAAIAQAIANYATFSASDNGGVSPYNALTIAAAGADESSYEDDHLVPAGYLHGIMTYFLLKAPAEGDLNADGVITVLEMFALAKAGIETQWNPSVSAAAAFLPHISGGPIDLVLFEK
jgi:hypothetical protein